jgi:adenylate kinase
MKAFVAGLSRSGKTSRSQYAAETLPDVDYVSVSGLLRAAGRAQPVQTIGGALENQRYAADALGAAPATRPHRLIDGHALIETGEGPVLVPDWFFDLVAPDVVIVVCDRPEEILSRRPLTAKHDQLAEIVALSAMEQAACQRAAARLRIPCVSLMAPSLEEFAATLRQRLR